MSDAEYEGEHEFDAFEVDYGSSKDVFEDDDDDDGDGDEGNDELEADFASEIATARDEEASRHEKTLKS